VASREIVDHGHGATRVESPPGDFAPITPSSKFDFDQVGVQRAIRQNQEKQTDLRLMRRGIPRFEVAKRAARRDAVRPLATLSPADFGTVSQRLAALASTSGDGTEATQS